MLSTLLPDKPSLDESVIVRGTRPLGGLITKGETYAWRPDWPQFRALIVVTQVTSHLVRARTLGKKGSYWNPTGVFRDACFRTTL